MQTHEEEINTQVLTDVEWYEPQNVGLTADSIRPVYKNRPPPAFPVLYNPNTRTRTVITSHFKVGWDFAPTTKEDKGMNH